MSIDLSGFKVRKNVEFLEDAEVVALGETHFNIKDQKRNARVIDALYKRGDVVLVEASDENLKSCFRFPLTFQVHYVTKPIVMKGWDIHSGSLGKQICQDVGPLFVASLITCGAMISAPSIYLSIGAWVGFCGFGFRKLYQLGKRAIEGLPSRDRHMVNVIKETLKGGARRVIVIAGKYHFEFDRETLNYFRTRKFAVLT